MRKLLLRVGEKRNVWRIPLFVGCITLLSLYGAGFGKATYRPSSPQIHQVDWQGPMENLNLEALLFYPSNDVTRLFRSERAFADPFVQKATDIFTPTVIAIEGRTQTITLRVVVKLPSGSSTVIVPDVSNKTALYLSIPDRRGALKASNVPFCYVWGMRWGLGNRSFTAVIDYTVSDQITWR